MPVTAASSKLFWGEVSRWWSLWLSVEEGYLAVAEVFPEAGVMVTSGLGSLAAAAAILAATCISLDFWAAARTSAMELLNVRGIAELPDEFWNKCRLLLLGPGRVTNSVNLVVVCWHLTIKDHCEKMCFPQTHNQDLH